MVDISIDSTTGDDVVTFLNDDQIAAQIYFNQNSIGFHDPNIRRSVSDVLARILRSVPTSVESCLGCR